MAVRVKFLLTSQLNYENCQIIVYQRLLIILATRVSISVRPAPEILRLSLIDKVTIKNETKDLDCKKYPSHIKIRN